VNRPRRSPEQVDGPHHLQAATSSDRHGVQEAAERDQRRNQVSAGFLIPAWALARLHNDPRSPMHKYRKDLRGRDTDLYKVLLNMCVAALPSETGPVRAPTSDVGEYSNQLTTAQAAAELNVTQRQVVRLIETGHLTSRRTGRGPHLVDASEVEALRAMRAS